MYLSEEKRSAIREYIEKHQSNIGLNPGQNKENHIKGFHYIAGERQFVSLFY
jgi:hypothetical protein